MAAQSNGGYQVTREGGSVVRVRGRWTAPVSGSAAAQAESIVELHREELGIPSSVNVGSPEEIGTAEARTVRLALSAHGVPIDGGEILVQVVDDTIWSITVRCPLRVAQSEPALTPEQAESVALQSAKGLVAEGEPTLTYFAPQMLSASNGEAQLVWRVQTVAEDRASAPTFFIDAQAGTVAWTEDRYVAELDRYISDGKGSSSRTIVDDYRDNPVYFESGPNSAATSISQEATLGYQFAEQACAYLDETFGEDGPCAPLYVYVNFGPESDAYADGKTLVFGTGTLAAADGLETFAHELGHGLTYLYPDYARTLEPGAVNEAIADILAMLIVPPADGLWKTHDGSAVLRDHANPSSTNHPDHYDKRRTLAEGDVPEVWNDYGETHANAVILSHGTWLATVQGVTVGGNIYPGIGASKLGQILYYAITNLATSTSSLRQAADDMILACITHAAISELYVTSPFSQYGIDATDCGVLANAFAQVGLADADRDLDGWSDDQDNCPDLQNVLQTDENQNRTGDDCELAPPDASVDAAVVRDGAAEPINFPEEPERVPTCPATLSSVVDGFPTKTFVLLSQSAPSCSVCDGFRGRAYITTCTYNFADDSWSDVEVKMRWQPWDPAKVKLIHSYDGGPGCVEGTRQIYQLAGGGHIISSTHDAYVEWDNFRGDDDPTLSQMSLLLDQLEGYAVECPES